jgi:DNA-binding CsgD family transcriptional regulator
MFIGIKTDMVWKMIRSVGGPGLLIQDDQEFWRERQVVSEFSAELVVCGSVAFECIAGCRMADAGRRAMQGRAADTRGAELSGMGSGLRARERELIWMLYRGLTNREIAEAFGVAIRTVKGYLSQLFKTFDVSNRTELVGSAVDLGLLGKVEIEAIERDELEVFAAEP